MATDLEKLVVQLSADIKGYEREMRKAMGVTNAQARAIENRYRQMNKNLDAIGRGSARALIAPLTGIAAAVSVREVLQYADAWTSAKNSLAVAGVVGANQVDVLERLYQSAQANAAPVGALADLFGKAAQASDNLGASQAELLKFSDGVAVALRVAGTSASQASGALTQLGQLLGSARVQAEEFNSVNDGARPILIAVANGLDAAGGSVSKLKSLVTEGKVSGQQFFQAFLKGLPTIQAMAANATQTIEQGITKVNNAFTKYIGSTDESLGASQRLVAGLNALADNFEGTADVVLKLAAVIAGALVGRTIVGMIASLGLGVAALTRFTVALRAATTMAGLSTAFSGLSAAAGPVGLVIGGAVVGALALFATSSSEASSSALSYAAALKEVEERANAVAPAVEGAANAIDEKSKNILTGEIEVGIAKIEEARDAVVNLFTDIIDNAPKRLITDEQLTSLENLRDGLKNGTLAAKTAEQAIFALANSNPNFQRMADQLAPLLAVLGNAIAAVDLLRGKLGTDTSDAATIAGYRQYGQSRAQGEEMLRLGKEYAAEAERQNSLSKQQLAVEKEIANIRKDLKAKGGFLPDDQIKIMATANVAADARRSKEGKKPPVPKKDFDDRFGEDIQAIRDRTAALVEEQSLVGKSYFEQEKRRAALDLEQEALRELREEARKKGVTDLEAIKLSPEQVAKIDEASDAYARQADILRQVTEAQQRAEDAAMEFYDTFKSGMIGAITGAKSFKDALSDVLAKLGDMLLNSAFDSLFKPSVGGASGGVFGNIFSAIGKFVGFDEGGYTGPGGRDTPAGVVHAGEFVFSKDAVNKIGVRNLEALHRQLKGFKAGGFVGPSVPNLSRMQTSANGNGPQFTYAPQIDARGADVAAVARLEQVIIRDRQTFEGRVRQIVQQRHSKGW